MSASRSKEELGRSLRTYEKAGAVIVFVLVFGLFGWSSIAAVASAVIAPGVVAVSGQAKKVQHLEGGIVSEILVRNADVVQAGQILVRFDATEANASLQIMDQKAEELSARRARLRAELDNTENLVAPEEEAFMPRAGGVWGAFSGLASQLTGRPQRSRPLEFSQIWQDQAKLLKSRREARLGKEQQFTDRVSQMDEVVTGLIAQQAALEKQLALIKDELKGLEQLEAQQLVPKTKVAALRREAAKLDGQRGQYVSEIAKTKVQISETQTQLTEYRQQTQSELLTELRDVTAQFAEAREKQIAISARLDRLTVVAPQSGIVHKLGVHTVGGVVSPGQIILEIVPQQETLVLEGRLDPAYVDQVKEGQTVGVRLVALDQTKTPEVEGKVAAIAPDVRQDAPDQAPYYALTVHMDEAALAGVPGRLVPGMPVELLVRGKDRTVLAYLVKPLRDRLAHTFRE